MALVHPTPLLLRRRSGAALPSRCSHPIIRSSVRFPPEKAQFRRELEAAIDAVERACLLCVDVKKSLLSSDRRILEKSDRTPVTIADFGVQALISLELGRLFPLIPLVAEEDSAFLRSSVVEIESEGGNASNFLVESVFSAVVSKASGGGELLTTNDVLEAIDRGGKNAFSFDAKPATYWVLDPIDGTRGFLKGSDALYVVGLALVVNGEIVLGVMGCPNWKEDIISGGGPDKTSGSSGSGIIMAAHVGCGTWTRRLHEFVDTSVMFLDGWMRCSVDSCSLVHEARYCIPESETWELIPLSVLYSSTTDNCSYRDEREILLFQTCCGSLCKYMMVASGRASVFVQRAKIQKLIKVWDHAVGIICVHEAGGQVTDWRGSDLDLAADKIERRIIFPFRGILVTNGDLHKQLLELISSNSPVS